MATLSFTERIKAALVGWGFRHQDFVLSIIRNLFFIPIVMGQGKKLAVITRYDDVEEVLQRPNVFGVIYESKLRAAAHAGDDDLLAKYIFEASRYYPLAPALFRDCLDDYRVAGGTWRSKLISKGTRVVVVLRSAMFDGRHVDNPKNFRIDRADHNYLHFGYGEQIGIRPDHGPLSHWHDEQISIQLSIAFGSGRPG